jgi:hypothetical protein
MSTQRIDQRRALPDRQLARPVQHQHALLFRALHRHEPHRRPRRRFADRRRIGRVVLLPAHIGLHISWRYQLRVMTEPLELARPVMRGGAGFDADDACRQLRHERQELTPPHRTPQHRLAGHVDAVKLKDGLRQIDPDGGDPTVCCMLIPGRRSLGDPFRQRPSWHIRRRVGAVHPITEIDVRRATVNEHRHRE